MVEVAEGGGEAAAYLTVRQVAALLRVTKETVYVWLREKRIPARKVGGTWRFDRVQLEGFMRGGKEGGP